MDSYSANDAKTQFGQLLMKVQREPVEIKKNGKPVAVMISVNAFDMMTELVERILDIKPDEDAETSRKRLKRILIQMDDIREKISREH